MHNTEEDYIDKQHMLDSLLEVSPDHIYFKDLQSRFLALSRSQAERFGLSGPEEALGKTDFDFFSEEHARQAYEDEQEIIRTEQEKTGIEEKETWPDGSETWVSTTKMPYYDSEGNLAGTFGISRDITARRRAQMELELQLEFQQMMGDISSAFVSEPAENIDRAGDYALQRSGEFLGADRSYVFQFSEDRTEMSNTHEWCDNGVESAIESMQSVSMEALAWLGGKHLEAEYLFIEDVNKVPVEHDRELLKSQGIQSLLAIPLVSENQHIGFFGYDAVKEKKVWTEGQIEFLKVLGEIISNGLVKRRTYRAIKESEEKYRTLYESAPIGIATTTSDGRVLDANPVKAREFGYSSPEEMKTKVSDFGTQHYADPARRDKLLDQLREKGHINNFEFEAVALDGRRFWLSLFARVATRNEDGGFVIEGFSIDITRRKALEKKLVREATEDDLTGLSNRRSFMEDARLELIRADRYGGPLSFLMLDIDHFKSVNDNFGHSVGDSVLRRIAELIENNLRKVDLCGRLGGEEFGILLPNTGIKEAGQTAERLRRAIADTGFKSDGEEVFITASIGVAEYSETVDSFEALLREGDDAMYRAKARGRNCVSS